MQKAGGVEKFDKMGKGSMPQSPANMPPGNMMDNGDMMMFKPGLGSSGLQTTPSPQLMNYIEFEGQELVITKQLNMSYKGDDEKGMFGGLNGPQPPPPPPNGSNQVILNCLNSNNGPSNQSPSTLDDGLKIKGEMIEPGAQNLLDELASSFPGPGPGEDFGLHMNNKKPSKQGHPGTPQPNDPFYNPINQISSPHNPNSNSNNPNSNQGPINNPNSSQSPIGLVNGGNPLNSMLQMTNSIPKASPYASAKSPGLMNNPQYGQGGPPPPQGPMGLPPSPLGMQQAPPPGKMQMQGMMPPEMMGNPKMMMGNPNQQPPPPPPPLNHPGQPAPNPTGSSRRGHSEPKLSKKEKLLQQQQQQQQQQQHEMMMQQQQQQQRGNGNDLRIK